jgi:hypothetical protein
MGSARPVVQNNEDQFLEIEIREKRTPQSTQKEMGQEVTGERSRQKKRI